MTGAYDAWNAALSARFLQGRSGVPLYLYTDDSVLEEVCGELGVSESETKASFVTAVRETLGQQEPFKSWSTAAARVLGEGEAPSYLAVLCFLVLVGVEQETTHFQYYPELNKNLGRARDAGAPLGFDVHVASLFSRFNDWLEGDGRVHGTPTARSHAHFPHVGWPLSQAIVRPVDRALLIRLFVSEGLRPGEERSGNWLRNRLISRIRTSAASASRTRLIDLNDCHAVVLEDVLEKEYEGWDGSPDLVVGPRRVQLRLCFDETQGEWWFIAPRVDGTQRKQWHIGELSGAVPAFKGIEAVPQESEVWALLGRGDVGSIDDGPLLCSRRARLRWLVQDDRAGGWAEVARRDPSAEHLVLVDGADAAALAGLSHLEQHEESPTGHLLIRVPVGSLLEESALPAVDLRPRLEGGLRLDGATATYLSTPGALPVIAPASSARVGPSAVAVESGRALLSRVTLGTGDFVAEVDGSRLPFRLVDRLLNGPVEGAAPSWTADLPVVRRFRVPHSIGSIWLVGERGELEERPGTSVTWIKELGLVSTDIDVANMMASTWFAPTYVISTFQGKPWVEPVPEGMAKAQPSEAPRVLNRVSARDLVSQLLVDYEPKRRHSDSQWKRCFAGLMRTAHR